jgi:hypothetical protein
MFYKNEIQDVIRRCFAAEYKSSWTRSDTFEDHDSEISTLIHDVFGGEILKTHKNKRWHFYNRINGERVDLALPGNRNSPNSKFFEDIPSNTSETSDYFDRYDYSEFFMKFVNTFEETIGLGHYKHGLSS